MTTRLAVTIKKHSSPYTSIASSWVAYWINLSKGPLYSSDTAWVLQ